MLRLLSGRAFAIGIVLAAGCVQAPPRATVRVTPGSGAAAGAVLVMPTTCVASGVYPGLCSPASWNTGTNPMMRVLAATYGPYVDPPLRLRLEFAGYTLAEAAAMRLTTGDRTDVRDVVESGDTVSSSAHTEIAAGESVAALAPPDVRAVARSLALTGIVTSTLTLTPARYGEVQATLNVTLWDVASDAPRWAVTCAEHLYDPAETPTRLAACVGNGVLAALAPDNLIGRAL